MDSAAGSGAAKGPTPYRPPGGRTLIGPLLTERAFALRAGLSPAAVRRDRCIPRIGSPVGLEAAYPAFMLDESGLRLDAAFIALLLRRRVSDLEACDWLTREHPALGGLSPLAWMARSGDVDDVVGVLPRPTKEMPTSVARSEEVEDMRRQWVQYRGEESSPGWTIDWDRVGRHRTPAPHGV